MSLTWRITARADPVPALDPESALTLKNTEDRVYNHSSRQSGNFYESQIFTHYGAAPSAYCLPVSASLMARSSAALSFLGSGMKHSTGSLGVLLLSRSSVRRHAAPPLPSPPPSDNNRQIGSVDGLGAERAYHARLGPPSPPDE